MKALLHLLLTALCLAVTLASLISAVGFKMQAQLYNIAYESSRNMLEEYTRTYGHGADRAFICQPSQKRLIP